MNTTELLNKFAINQSKIVKKIQGIQTAIDALVMTNNGLVQQNTELRNRIGGIETILADLGVSKEAIELHQGFSDEKLKEKQKEPEGEQQEISF